MAITRINEFRARKGKGDTLYSIFAAVQPSIQAAPGCLSCRLIRGVDDPDLIVLLEEWARVEDHQAALKAIPPSEFEKVMPLLAGPPSGVYFQG